MFGSDFKALLARRETRAALLSVGLALLLLAVGHAFGYLNLIYSGSGVMVDASQGSVSQVAAGRWAQPLYWALRGGVSAPMLVGLLCGAYLAAAAALIALSLGMTRPLSLALLAGALCAECGGCVLPRAAAVPAGCGAVRARAQACAPGGRLLGRRHCA